MFGSGDLHSKQQKPLAMLVVFYLIKTYCPSCRGEKKTKPIFTVGTKASVRKTGRRREACGLVCVRNNFLLDFSIPFFFPP